MSEETADGEVQNTEVSEAQIATEKEARLLGWVPKEEFRDGDHWVDAETFVKRGKEINPILRKNNETLMKKLEAAQAEVAEVKKVAKEFEKFQKENAERKVKELEAQLVALKQQKKEAISMGDGEAVIAIDDEIDATKEAVGEAKKESKAPQTEDDNKPKIDPEFQLAIETWMVDNDWFTKDIKMSRIADAVGMEVNAKYPHLKGKAFFDKLDEELEEVLPEKYRKKPRTSPVEGSTRTARSTSTKKESYDNLPAEAKAACDRFVKQGLMTKEEYVSSYDWS